MSVGAISSAQRNSLPYLCFTFLSDTIWSDYSSATITCMAINMDISCVFIWIRRKTVKEPLHKCLINFSKVPTTAAHTGNICRTVQILCREGADYTTPQCVFSKSVSGGQGFLEKTVPQWKKKKKKISHLHVHNFCKSS